MSNKLSPTNIADRMGAISRVKDQTELYEARIRELHVEFIKHIARTEAVPICIRRKAKTILTMEDW